MECCGAVGDVTCALGCVNFCQAADDSTLCDCGHKKYRHRIVAGSDTERLEQLKQLIISTNEKIDEKIGATYEKIGALNSALGYIVDDILDPWCGIRTNDGSDASGCGKTSERTDSILGFYGIDKDVCMVLGKCDEDESREARAKREGYECALVAAPHEGERTEHPSTQY